jgi:tRNA A-37 threonylcarbamoyl transferase component Bud32
VNVGPVPLARHGGIVEVDSLFARGASPALPFIVQLPDVGPVVVEELLRVLPRRRIVARVRWRESTALLKLYARAGSARREQRGLERLHAAGIAAPALLHALERALLLEWLPGVRDFRAAWHATTDEVSRVTLLGGAVRLIRALHAVGLHQRDLHPGNVLCSGDGRQWMIDGAGIAPAPRFLRAARDRANLALFLSSLPPAERGVLQALRQAHGDVALPPQRALERALAACDRARARLRARKSLRDCRQFRLERTPGRLLVLRRDREDAALRAVLRNPRAALAAGKLLKAGNSATVARITAGDRELVLKHYHRRRLLPAWLWPTRARRAWQNCARLARTGVAAPRALALLEERRWLRGGDAWLVYEYVVGTPLAEQLRAGAAAAGPVQAIRGVFTALRAIGCSHGDCKASNFIVDGDVLRVVDLDAMRTHRWHWTLERGLAKDRARFVANLPESDREHLAVLLREPHLAP